MNNSTMTAGEVSLLKVELAGCRHYLEFGSGASTKLAVEEPRIERIDVVESDGRFIDTVLRSDPAVRIAEIEGRLFLHHIDVGPVRDWGRPANRARYHLWPAYALSMFAVRQGFDLVLVDGIFRGACVLAAGLSQPDIRILIHDFWLRRRYRFLLRFLRCEQRVDSMGLFTVRRDADRHVMQRILAVHQYLPDDEKWPRRLLNSWQNWIRAQ